MRTLYLVCYDVSSPKRLKKVHSATLAYAVGSQKSFYECWLTPVELNTLFEILNAEIDTSTDRIHIFQLDPRMTPWFYGRAIRQSTKPFMIV